MTVPPSCGAVIFLTVIHSAQICIAIIGRNAEMSFFEENLKKVLALHRKYGIIDTV